MRDIADIYPLSPMQQGMVFHSLMTPETGVYIESIGYTLRGELDVESFIRAWQTAAERHSILRTAFVWEGVDQPLQAVFHEVDLPLQQEDWRAIPREEHGSRLAELIEGETRSGFSLAEPPLWRLRLIRTGEKEWSLIWTHHHALLDGWSVPILFGEIFSLYEAYRNGRSLSLPPAHPYRDYIAWIQRQNPRAAENYWRGLLAGFTSPTPLMVNRGAAQHPGDDSPENPTEHLSLSAQTTEQLQALARKHQLTLSTILQGAWAILLNRYSGESDIVYGSTVSGRSAELPGAESMVGLFINTLPNRVRIEDGLSVLSILKELQQQQVQSRQFEYSSLIQIQGWSETPRSQPLFQSIFVFENYPVEESLGSLTKGLEFSEIRSLSRTNFPLTVVASPGKEVGLEISYDRHQFDRPCIQRMLGHLRVLLEGMAADPGARAVELPMLIREERQLLLEEWNRTEVDFPADYTFHRLFEEEVLRAPQAPAIVFEGTTLSYREVNDRANRMGNYLQRLGVGPETIVGLCIERSPEMLVGVLGILKAGGAYLPLDPNYPADRLSFMIEDANPPVLIAQSHLLERLPEIKARIVLIDRDWEVIEQEETGNPSSNAAPGNLAYVIYTSGSTGRPKGTLIEHASLCHLVFAQRRLFTDRERSCVLQFAPFSFDAMVWEMALALGSGGRLVLARQETLTTMEDLHELIAKEGVTFATLPPSVLRLLSSSDLPELQVVIAAGERCTSEIVKRWLPGRRFINGYGPTETTVCATLGECQNVSESDPPIGRPFLNTKVYILNERRDPVPVGVPGELYVGGAGLARGYLNRPDLTDERFIANPFSKDSTSKLYKTGDLVRYLPDGNLEFLGRVDDQVKIRGLRIELGEIETLLRGHPRLANAAVAAQRQANGDPRLVAYLVAENEDLPASVELRDYLKSRLPEYMVPSIFVALESLPMLPNGKLNRRALPEPEWEKSTSESAYFAPRTPSEELMCEIWAQVLEVERVGLDDEFFVLGGHSLLATQLVSRVREAFGVELPLRSLFERPTVRSLIEEVEKLSRGEGGLAPPPIRRISRDGELALSFAQQRLWFLDQLEPASPFYNNPMALRLRGPLDVEVLNRCLNIVVERHEALRTTFETSQGRPVQIVSPSLTLPLPVDDLGHLPADEREAEARRLAGEEASLPFDLARGPLLRARLLRLGEEEYLLLATLHHIVSDGWSMNVLVREVTALYRSLIDGEQPRLPELPIQYADYAQWQRDWLQGEALARQTQYWTNQLSAHPTVLELPTDYPRPALQSSNGAQFDFHLSPELTRRLRELSRQEGATLFMTLLAAFQTLMHRYTGQEEINVGTPIANRTREEVEGLIGFFVNTLVMRANLSGDPGFVDLLGRVRETALGAYAHQDLPFEQLVEALQPERDLSHTPLFQVMFMLQNTPRSNVELKGLTVEPLATESRTARFDLTVEMNEGLEGLSGTIEYNTDLFEAATIERMARHFHNLLEGIVADPEQTLSQLPLLDDEEATRITRTWNQTIAPYPDDICFQRMFEEQVETRPDAAAVTFAGQTLSYLELNERANRMARYLGKMGVGPETIVGLYVERSIEMIVGLLGIMKAGGAYLPLDPNYPAERLAFMFRDSQAPVLVTQESLTDRFPANDARVVRIDADWERIAVESGEFVESGARPDHPAYVIYTSGSTGQPKGTLLEHRGLCNLARAQQGLFGVREGKRVLQFSPLSFDASVWEVAMSLGSGATLVLARQEQLTSLEELHSLLKAERISVVTLPASVLRLLETDGLDDLEVVIAAGERCTPEIVRRWQPGRRFFNCYGPTETTVCATAEECTDLDDRDPPIGRPLPNTEIYLLDRYRQVVPVGVAGELHVGGVCLARGYLRRDEMTREKFIRHPFSTERNARLYRTGDLARYRADGRIEYLGRVDEQVKVRGYRIELGEIESVLREIAGVREAAVCARDDGRGDKRLVGYIVPAGDEMPSPVDLKQYLRDKLPEYMVPATYVRLDRIPLSPSGKVDRKSLPEPDSARPEMAREYIAPRTETETTLAQVWSELLGVERVGAEDNFFELGGHSLLATQVMSRVREIWQVEVPLRALFETPTLADLATAIEKTRQAPTVPEAPAITPVSRESRRMKRSALGGSGNRMTFPDNPTDPLSEPER